MRKAFAWFQHNALNLTLLLMSVAIGVSIYALEQSQAERSAAIMRNCQDQNVRHRNTINELNILIGKAEKHVSRAKRAEIEASRVGSNLIIDTLAPYQNCQRLLAKSTSTK